MVFLAHNIHLRFVIVGIPNAQNQTRDPSDLTLNFAYLRFIIVPSGQTLYFRKVLQKTRQSTAAHAQRSLYPIVCQC